MSQTLNPKPSTRAKSITTKSVVNEDLDDQAMLKKYKKEIDNLKKKLRYTSAGGDKDLEICQMINQVRCDPETEKSPRIFSLWKEVI